ncbi:(Fe-S)-binding protein [Desulfobacterales bacterium HSG17]|nr:(Fe-S)-binding protein [Desulfobacterales bacterium HSG17]
MEPLAKIYKKAASRKFQAMLNTCVNCGLCAEACHYYCSEPQPNLIPTNRNKILARVVAKYFHPIKSRIPMLSAKPTAGDSIFDDLFEAAFQNCTLCAKCALVCPMGINTGDIMAVARTLLFGLDKVPDGLVEPVRQTLETGNYLGLTQEDFVETMEWVAEEMEDDMGEGFTIPIDQKNCNVLYIPHPLTIRDLTFLLMDEIKILEAAGESYTFSSDGFDTVNYALYQGNKPAALLAAKKNLKARESINAKSIALAPCGHGYRMLRWETERMMGHRFDFPIYTLVELIDQYIQDGRLKLNKDVLEGPVTYHDPCNIARRGGVIEEPRRVIAALSDHFIEMQPHGVHNFCCGGGGGLASTASFGKVRKTSGAAKAEQIRKTDAKTVITGCFNCKTQIRDIGKHYDLGIQVKSIVEVVSSAITTFC